MFNAQTPRRRRLVEQLDAWGVGCGLLIAVGIFVYQVYHWGTTLDWPSIPVRWAFDFFGIGLGAVYGATDWEFIAKIARVLLDLPLSVMSLVTMILLSNLLSRFVAPE